jgi:hypothetical protein
MKQIICVNCGNQYKGSINILLRKLDLSKNSIRHWIKFNPRSYKFFKLSSSILSKFGLDENSDLDNRKDLLLCYRCQIIAADTEKTGYDLELKQKREKDEEGKRIKEQEELKKSIEESKRKLEEWGAEWIKEHSSDLLLKHPEWEPAFNWLRKNELLRMNYVTYHLTNSRKDFIENGEGTLSKPTKYHWGESYNYREEGIKWELVDYSRFHYIKEIEIPYMGTRTVRKISLSGDTLIYQNGMRDTQDYGTLAENEWNVEYWTVIELTPVQKS